MTPDFDFLPVSRADMQRRGWDELDFIFVSGDAYVDHPSFGPAIICRLLEAHGYKIGIIAQPDWRKATDFCRLGRPRLGFLVSSGNMDSLLNAYTAAKKRRRADAYSPGGQTGLRPLRAVLVYTAKLREIYGPSIPIIIGGIEASLRRFVHYDYWSDSLRHSILADAPADLLIYGMGEKAILAIAAELNRGLDISLVQDIPGTCYRVPGLDYVYDYQLLPSFAEIAADKKIFAAAFQKEYLAQDPVWGKKLVQPHDDCCIVQNPPAPPLSEAEMDEIYDLPYRRTWHSDYDALGGVPALKEVEFSLTSQRGCFGGCHFCAIAMHQGRIIQQRSHASLLREASLLTKLPNFKGYIHDVGGPTANFRVRSCQKQLLHGTCRDKSCLSPTPCPNLKPSHADYLALLKKLRAVPGVKKVFIRSGIRYDYLLLAPDGEEFLQELCRHHVSGQLKIAPEHISDRVTHFMGKSGRAVYLQFVRRFQSMNEQLGKKQYLVPYFMSSHPGAGLKEAVQLAEFLHAMGYRPQQVQDFIPTPGTLSTAMYYSGCHPLTGETVWSAKTPSEKKLQRALLQYWLPENRPFVEAALKKAGRLDLIGYRKNCLIAPATPAASPAQKTKKRK